MSKSTIVDDRSPPNLLGGPPRLYTWNFFIAFLAQTAFTTTNSLLAHYPRWVEFLGGDVVAVGTVSSISAFVGLVFRPVLAPWIDRIGPRACWCIAGIVVMISSLANLWMTDVGPMLYVCRSLMAVGIAVVFACGLTYVAHITPIERRAEAIGVLGAGGFAGLLIGPALGDVFLSNTQRTLQDFVWYFGCCAGGVVASILLVLANRPTPKHESSSRAWHPATFLRVVRKYWPGPILAVTFAFGTCMTVPFVFLATYIDRLSDSDLGPFFLIYASVGLVVRLGLRSWPDQFGPKRVLMAGMGFFAAGMWAFIFAKPDQYYWILIAAAICGTAHGLTFHSMVSLVLEPFPPEHRGTGSVLALMGVDSGMFFSSQVLAIIVEWFGYPALFHSVALICVASIVVIAVSSMRGRPGESGDDQAPPTGDDESSTIESLPIPRIAS